MSLKITRTRETLQKLASTNRKHKKLNLLLTELRGAFACALACVRKNFVVKSRNCISVRLKKTKISV